MDIFNGTKLEKLVGLNKRLFQGIFPELIKRLILNSCNGVTHIRIPGNDDIWAPGFDGIVENSCSTPYVCEGLSVWECGTNSNSLKKINDDYSKRTSNPLGVDTKNAELILAVPYIWAYDNQGWAKTKWESEHKSDWKNVRIYDAVVLAEWVNSEPAVCAWLLEQVGQTADIDFSTVSSAWNRFASKTSPAFSHSLFLEGRQKEEKTFQECLNNQIIRVKADSIIDAYGFCLSALQKNIDKSNTVIIINNQITYKKLSQLCKDKTFLLNFQLDSDVIDGNQVILCYNKEDYTVHADVEIFQLTKSLFDKAINDMNVPGGQTANLYESTHGNLLSLIRKIPGNTIAGSPKWASQDKINLLAPILLLRDYDIQNEYEQNLVAYLAGEEYNTILDKYKAWIFLEDAPIKCVSEHIILINFEEAWEVLHLSTTSPIFDRLLTVINGIVAPCGDTPNYIDQHTQRHLHNLFLDLIYFSYIDGEREKVSQSVKSIFKSAQSLNLIFDNLSLMAEAAPTTVMSFLLERKNDIVVPSFRNNDYTNDYCKTLFALDELVLHDETRVSACDYLFDLCLKTRDVHFTISNSPKESLLNALCLWNDCTTFTICDKVTLIKKYISTDESFSIPFTIDLILKNSIFHGMRKGSKMTPKTPVFSGELFKAINELGVILFKRSIETHSITNLKKLLGEYYHFYLDTLVWASGLFNADQYDLEELVSLNAKLHEKIYYAKMDKDMEPWLPALEAWINVTTPQDEIARYGWLFFDYYHCFLLEASDDDNWENNQKAVEKKRIETLDALINNHSVEDLKLLVCWLEDASSWGAFFANRLSSELLFAFVNEARRLNKHQFLFGLIDRTNFDDCITILNMLTDEEQETAILYLYRRDILEWLDTPKKEKLYWSHQQMLEYDTKIYQKLIIHNPSALLSYYACFQKESLSVNIYKIIEVFNAVLSFEPSIKSGRVTYELDKILSRIDKEGYYSVEWAKLCASLYDINLLGHYPAVLKRYYFENPNILCDKILQLDGNTYSQFNFKYMLPDSAYSNPDAFASFVKSFIDKHTEKNLLLPILGSILGKSQDGSDGIFPHELVRIEMEKYREYKLNREVLVGKNNSQGVRIISDGTSEKALAQKLKEDAKKVDATYPETAQLLRWLSDDYLLESKHDQLYSEIGISIY